MMCRQPSHFDDRATSYEVVWAKIMTTITTEVNSYNDEATTTTSIAMTTTGYHDGDGMTTVTMTVSDDSDGNSDDCVDDV